MTKFCHAPRTARGFRYCRNGGVNVRLDWPTTTSGSKSESASTNNDFGTFGVYFVFFGNLPTNSTRRWSRNGTRTSRELAMLAESVSRRSVFTMYDCNSKQETEVKESSCPACRAVSRIRARQGNSRSFEYSLDSK